MNAPLSELERLLSDPRQGPESHPRLFRLLCESTLVFLMPYHPEIMGTMSLKNGDQGPKFVVWKGAEGLRIPIFTSIERANEACKKIGARDKQYALAEMNGQQLFALLSSQKYSVMINPACGPATTHLDTNAIKMLADGSILKPIDDGPRREGKVVIVDPADYPTDLLQPLFFFLRNRKEVKAAWLFREADLPPDSKVSYVFVLKVVGNAEKLKQDFAVVATGAAPPDVEFGVTTLDAANKPLVAITAKATPFYAAPGFKSPGLL